MYSFVASVIILIKNIDDITEKLIDALKLNRNADFVTMILNKDFLYSFLLVLFIFNPIVFYIINIFSHNNDTSSFGNKK